MKKKKEKQDINQIAKSIVDRATEESSTKPMTFKERAKIAAELLAKQGPVTLEEAREQVQRLKRVSTTKTSHKKQPKK